MKLQATILLAGLTLGMAQPVSTVVLPQAAPIVTARAATTKDDIQYEGDYGVHWTLSTSGVLHLGAGTLADEPMPPASGTGTNDGQFAKQIALKQGFTTPSEAELTAAGSLVTKVVLDGPIKTSANAANLFAQLPNVTDYENLNLLDTSAATTMKGMFLQMNGNKVLTSLDVSHFNTKNVTTMWGMFYGLKGVSELDLSSFDTGQVTAATSKFNGASSLQTINLANATFANLKDAGYMLSGSDLRTIRLDSFAPPATFSGYSMFANKTTIGQVTFGPKTHFAGDPKLNDAIATPDEFTGLWQAVGKGTLQNPLGDEFAHGKDITDLYNGTDNPSGIVTYVWQPVNRVIEPTTPPVVTPPTVTPPAVTQSQPVTVRYLDEKGNQLANNQVLTGDVGAIYQANQLRFAGYKLSRTEGQVSGTFSNQAQTVTFHYARNLMSGGDAATVAPIASVVYATKKIGLYQTKNFSKKTVKHWYSKQKRTNRPMFVVTGTAESKQGNQRYKVKDVNHKSKTAGKTGYITAKPSYVTGAYYATKQAKVKVIAKNGVNAYQQKSLKTKRVHYKKGQQLKVKKIVAYHKTTRFQLTNGKYVTANKKLVLAVK